METTTIISDEAVESKIIELRKTKKRSSLNDLKAEILSIERMFVRLIIENQEIREKLNKLSIK